MPSIDIQMYFIIAIIVLTIIGTVVSFVILGRLSAHINLLENEVDKRSSEFNAFRKERSQESSPAAAVIESNDPIPETSGPTISNEDTIHIFRNVRGTFEHSEHSTTNSHDEHPQPADASTKNGSSNIIQPSTMQHRKKVNNAQFTAIFMLYSERSKDADFQTLWNNLSMSLKQHVNPRMAIDFSNIHFLYEKEMEYLEKINYLIIRQGGTLNLVNCEQDIAQFLNRKKQQFTIITL